MELWDTRRSIARSDDDHSQPVRDRVCAVLFIPLMMSRNDFTFLVHIVAILRRRMVIKEAHERAVGHQRHDAVDLVVGEFQATNPEQPTTNPRRSRPIPMRSSFAARSKRRVTAELFSEYVRAIVFDADMSILIVRARVVYSWVGTAGKSISGLARRLT